MRSSLAVAAMSIAFGAMPRPVAAAPAARCKPGTVPELCRSKIVALRHVRVIDGTGTPALTDQTIVIEAGKIVSLGPSDRTAIPDGARTVDLRGRTVLPGLVMLHEHLFWVYEMVGGVGISHPEHFSFPRMYLAHGVTTLRTAGTDFPYMDLKLKRGIDSGALPGPEIHLTSPYFSGTEDPFLGAMDVRTADDARRAVRYWAAEGFTSFKAYQTVRKDVLAAMIDEAHHLKRTVTAHLGSVSCHDAAELGIDNIEHGCFAREDGLERDMNGPHTRALLQTLVEHHVVLTATPTDGSRAIPRGARELYDSSARKRLASISAEEPPSSPAQEKARRDAYANLLLGFVRAGGTLVLGSDAGSTGSIPGFADHEALENLVRFGFPPLEALRIATLGGATFLGIQDRTGSLQPGKEADLVIVRGNPDERIEDIEKVEIVFSDGVPYDPKALLKTVKGQAGWQ